MWKAAVIRRLQSLIGQRYLSKPIIGIISLLILSSSIIVYAELFTVNPSDVLQISDKPSRSTNSKDSLPLNSNGVQSGKSTTDTLGLGGSASSDKTRKDPLNVADIPSIAQKAKDTLTLSETPSAQSGVFHQVSTTESFPLSDLVSRSAAIYDDAGFLDKLAHPASTPSDTFNIIDKANLGSASKEILLIGDALSFNYFIQLLDPLAMSDLASSIGNLVRTIGADSMVLLDQLTAVMTQGQSGTQQPNEAEGRSGIGHLVYSDSYLEKHPELSKFDFRSFSIVDAQTGSFFGSITVGKEMKVKSYIENDEIVNQTYSFITQIRDSDGVTIGLIIQNGTIEAAQSSWIETNWAAGYAGTFTAYVMVVDDFDTPLILLNLPLSKTVNIAD